MNSNWKFFVFFSSHLQLTNTNTSGIVKYGSISAFAPITTDHVDTLAVGTCVNAEFSTFVNVLANICGRVQLRSSWTDALRYQKRLRFLWWTNQLDFVFFFTWKLPGVLRHCPPSQRRLSTAHLFMSVQVLPELSTWYPGLQIQRYVPSKFSQAPLVQIFGFWAHSLISAR
jgi:hypothetical protein